MLSHHPIIWTSLKFPIPLFYQSKQQAILPEIFEWDTNNTAELTNINIGHNYETQEQHT